MLLRYKITRLITSLIFLINQSIGDEKIETIETIGTNGMSDPTTTSMTTNPPLQIYHETSGSSSPSPSGRALFSPRVDYNNEWKPVGRGDPLKNDPTYDYSPPVLERVRYWAEHKTVPAPKKHQPDGKQEILLLGVPSKRPFHHHYGKKRDPPKYNMPIRRNYIHQLPLILMPPPMVQPYQNSISDWPSRKAVISDGATQASSNNFVVSLPTQLNDFNKKPINSQQHPFSPNPEYTNPSVAPKRGWIHALLQKEVTNPTEIVMAVSPTVYESHSQIYVKPSPSPEIEIDETSHFTPTVPPTPYPTTDSLFSHYHQSNEPQHGPLYLIIEGHSKVKTYGQGDEKHLPKIVPIETVENPVINHVVSKDEIGEKFDVKHLHVPKKDSDEKIPINESGKIISSMDSLLNLLDTSFGGLLVNDDSEKLSKPVDNSGKSGRKSPSKRDGEKMKNKQPNIRKWNQNSPDVIPDT